MLYDGDTTEDADAETIKEDVTINGERKIPADRKSSAGQMFKFLTLHAGLNPRSCTALSLTDSLVSLCEAWLRARSASYQCLTQKKNPCFLRQGFFVRKNISL